MRGWRAIESGRPWAIEAGILAEKTPIAWSIVEGLPKGN